MYKILLATDGSEHSHKTIEEAIKIAEDTQSETTVLSVVQNMPFSNYYQLTKSVDIVVDPTSAEKLQANLAAATRNLEEIGNKVLEDTKRMFEEKGLKVTTLLKTGQPADVICSVAEEGGFDIVILGSRGLGGIKEFILGSVTNKVAHCIKSNLLIIK